MTFSKLRKVSPAILDVSEIFVCAKWIWVEFVSSFALPLYLWSRYNPPRIRTSPFLIFEQNCLRGVVLSCTKIVPYLVLPSSLPFLRHRAPPPSTKSQTRHFGFLIEKFSHVPRYRYLSTSRHKSRPSFRIFENICSCWVVASCTRIGP